MSIKFQAAIPKADAAKYVKTGGFHCPFCGSNNIIGGEREFNEEDISVRPHQSAARQNDGLKVFRNRYVRTYFAPTLVPRELADTSHA